MKPVLWICIILFNCILAPPFAKAQISVPENNPVAAYQLGWTDELRWENCEIFPENSSDPDSLFMVLKSRLLKQSGGVIYFPPGDYEFRDHIEIPAGIIIRGSDPSRTDLFNPAVPDKVLVPVTDARDHRYELESRIHFPVYDGKNRNQAFKGVRMENPSNCHSTGVINLEIFNGHIYLGSKEGLIENTRNNRVTGEVVVFGNILRNTAVAGNQIPMEGQHENQIWMDRELGAITVYAGKNILIANNRIPRSGDHNFLMKDFLLYPSREAFHEKKEMISRELWFDYDHRTGIRVNFMPMLPALSIWERYPEILRVDEEKEIEGLTPGTLARGIVIRENYIFSTGKGGIKSTGRGTYIGYNVIRCIPELPLPSHTGHFTDAFVNDTRAIEIRGWEWTIECNDFEIYSNYTPEGVKYNDGEGIMHEAWENLDIRNSVIRNNTGNQYLCFWRVPVNGLRIEGNRIRTKSGWHAIYVNARARFTGDSLVNLPANQIYIRDNITEGGGIQLLGTGKGNSITSNIHSIPGKARVIDNTGALLHENLNYKPEEEQ